MVGKLTKALLQHSEFATDLPSSARPRRRLRLGFVSQCDIVHGTAV